MSPLDTTVIFSDNRVPKIKAGRFRTTLSQTLPAVEGAEAYLGDASHEFVITAPQFTLDQGAVHACFPPHDAKGPFDTVMPHIALQHRTLPWARRRTANDDEKTPWLALLLFGENELPGDVHAQGITEQMTVEAALTRTDGVTVPAVAIDDVAKKLRESVCRTLTVPAAVWRSIAPTSEDLRLLAHVRQQPSHVENATPTQEEASAVLVAGRLPDREGTWTAHLVSLEGVPLAPVGENAVRMVSLHSWSFTHHPDPTHNFSTLMRHLVAADGADDLLLKSNRMPPAEGSDAEKKAAKRLGEGYAPLLWHTPSGEETFGWYRGPAAPHLVPPAEVPVGQRTGRALSAHSLLAYEQDSGVFDITYASAWTLGRNLALGDAAFADALTHARRAVHHDSARLRQKMGERHALYAAPAPQEDSPGAPVEPVVPVLERFRQLLADGLAVQMARSLDGQDAPRLAPVRLPVMQPPITAAEDNAALAQSVSDHAPQLTNVAAWLTRLRSLEPVPFHYLVPHPSMLPDESLRFFHIDGEWLDALLAGARSLGVHHGFDTRADASLDDLINHSDEAPPAAGMLINSRLVEGWPSLEVHATTSSADGAHEVPVTLRKTFGRYVLLVLFADVPHTVTLAEPHQGLHFGLSSDRKISLRNPDANGAPLAQSVDLPEILRPADAAAPASVVDMERLRQKVQDVSGHQIDGGADVCIQLVRAPETQTIKRGA
ncbi:hypothetical protein AB8O64_35635 (plasmid) [Streptomyces sp. QH1-20]|uniref:hypothetical protein n=1 Tax=Streptomyces sp. QH1-20 TaxID=3240934 RepID=UPI003514A8BA